MKLEGLVGHKMAYAAMYQKIAFSIMNAFSAAKSDFCFFLDRLSDFADFIANTFKNNRRDQIIMLIN